MSPTRDGLEERVVKAVQRAVATDDGEMLVFLPGKGEISGCESALRGLESEANLELVAVHGSLPPEHLMRAFGRKAGGGKRRVFLATNVAETSLTLPGVTVVIDSGLARQRIHRGGRSALALVPISKASMDQRAGRAGRVRAGRCIRLFSARFRPQEENTPEIERIELDDVILQAGISGLDGEDFDRATWLSVPPEFAVEKARRRLQRMGALDDHFRLTEKGRVMGDLPVGGDEARMLLDPPRELAGTVADLVAILQGRGDLLLPGHLLGRGAKAVREARSELFAGLENEVYVQVKALRAGDARRHGLHGGALEEIGKIATTLRGLLGVQPEDPRRDRSALPEREALAAYLLDRVPESAFVARKRALQRRVEHRARKGKSEPWANGEVELAIWPFRPPVEASVGHEDKPDPVAGLVLDHFWLGDGGVGVRGTGRLVLPCTYRELLGAEIGEEEISEVRAGMSHGVPYVRAKVHTTYAGVTLESDERSLRGESLCREAARAMVAENFLKELSTVVLDDLHIWDLMARWPERDRSWTGTRMPPEPQQYLAERLMALGVRREDDLMLVEAEDLRPDLPEILGGYRFDIEKMAEEFPRIWEHLGFRYTVRVRPLAGEVLLEPVDKKTARHSDPNPRVVPRFRGFKVVYQNASRKIVIRG